METPTYKVAFSNMKLYEKIERDDPRSGWMMEHLMDSFINMELSQLDVFEKISLSHPFTTWHNGRKKQENFVAAQLIPVDMDTDDDDSSIETLKLHPIMRAYSFLTYATPSHMVVGPRSRALFLLDEPITTVEGYKIAAKVLYSFFPRCDSSVGEPSKFLYGMTSMDAPHWWNAKVLPIAQLRLWHSQWKMQQPQQETRNRTPLRMEDYRNTDLAVVADALGYVNPWSVDYKTWVGILAALKRQYGDEAQQVAVSWAQGKHNEVERDWANHLQVDRSGPVMTIGSIFHLAKQNGWQRKEVA